MASLDVLVTTYNGAAHLDMCLQSVCEQTWDDFTVLVIDNASTDRSADIANDWARRDPRVRYHRNPVNIGHMASANVAYAMTNAEYVLQLHGDDVLWPDFLARVVGEGLVRHPACGFAYSLFDRLIRGDRVPGTHQYRPALPTGVHAVLYPLCFTNWIIQSFAVFRRSRFDAVGGFERHLARTRADDDAVALRGGFVDHYMWARLASTGPAYVVDAPLGYYRIHEASQSTQSKGHRRMIQEAIRTYDYIYDDHDLFDDVARYLVKCNQIGRLLTDHGLIRTAVDMLQSIETGKEIAPMRKAFLTALHDALTCMIFDSPRFRDQYALEPPAMLEVLAQTIATLPPDGTVLPGPAGRVAA